MCLPIVVSIVMVLGSTLAGPIERSSEDERSNCVIMGIEAAKRCYLNTEFPVSSLSYAMKPEVKKALIEKLQLNQLMSSSYDDDFYEDISEVFDGHYPLRYGKQNRTPTNAVDCYSDAMVDVFECFAQISWVDVNSLNEGMYNDMAHRASIDYLAFWFGSDEESTNTENEY